MRHEDFLSRSPERSGWRVALTLMGVATAAAGGVAVFTTTNGPGSAALVTAGAVAVLLAALWERLQSVEAGGVKVALVEDAQRKLAAAVAAERTGDSTEAARLRVEAEELLRGVSPWATDYERSREALPPSPQRTQRMREPVAAAREYARARRDSSRPIDPGSASDVRLRDKGRPRRGVGSRS